MVPILVGVRKLRVQSTRTFYGGPENFGNLEKEYVPSGAFSNFFLMNFKDKTINLNIIHIVVLIIKLNIISTCYQVKERPERKQYISSGCEAPYFLGKSGGHTPPENFGNIY